MLLAIKTCLKTVNSDWSVVSFGQRIISKSFVWSERFFIDAVDIVDRSFKFVLKLMQAVAAFYSQLLKVFSKYCTVLVQHWSTCLLSIPQSPGQLILGNLWTISSGTIGDENVILTSYQPIPLMLMEARQSIFIPTNQTVCTFTSHWIFA